MLLASKMVAPMSVVMAVAGLTAGAPAQTSNSNAAVQQAIQDMQKELEKIRGENQAMKGQIDDLKAKTDADWLTETRAKEIRGLVEDVLADADQRASLLQDGMTAGWSDHFFLASADGRFKLTLEGMLQIRWIYNYHDQIDRHRQGFENSNTWLTFRGHVFSPDVEYLVRLETQRNTSGFVDLLDGWVRYSLNDDWSVRFGQFKLPFGREELVSESQQLAVERSLVNEATNVGRSQGIELEFLAGSSRFSAVLSDGATPTALLAQLLNASGQNVVNRTNSVWSQQDNEWAVTARYEHLLAGSWDQFSDFTSPTGEEFAMMFGFAGHAQQGEATGGPPFQRDEVRQFGLTADLSLEWGGANAFFSAVYHYVDHPSFQIVEFFGLVAQVGVYVGPKWEVFARGEYGQIETRSGGGFRTPDLSVLTFGVNYYIDGHDLKWTTDFSYGVSDIGQGWASDLAGFRQDADETSPQIVFRTQFQLLF